MSKALRFLPLALIALMIIALVWRLASPPETAVRSKLIGQRVPSFALPAALPPKPALTSADLSTGKPRLLNIFASWCVPCIAEAPVLAELHRSGVAIDGVAIRDRPVDVKRFLAEHGDPYDRIGADINSSVQLSLGSSGVPESFVVDGKGTIRYQHIGPITSGDISTLLREMEKAR